MIIFILITLIVVSYTHPWIDKYVDYRGEKHIVFWYTNLKGERKYINFIGDQK